MNAKQNAYLLDLDDYLGITPQGAGADCNSVGETHARFDS